jgi:hypothetical protein
LVRERNWDALCVEEAVVTVDGKGLDGSDWSQGFVGGVLAAHKSVALNFPTNAARSKLSSRANP